MMTSEIYETEKPKISPANVDVPGQMRGWFKLIETIRSTDPPTSQTNGHSVSKSPEPSPIQPPSPVPQRRSRRHKKITIRKSTKSKESLPYHSTSDSEGQRPALDPSTSLPYATDLQSLPGSYLAEIRDQRFLDYADFSTLSSHLHSCLHIEKKPFSSNHFSKQHIFKTRHNALNKIFKLAFLKAWKSDAVDFFSEALSPPALSPTSTTFTTDWSVNRRSSSSKPKNVFHILQLAPRTSLFPSSMPSSKVLSLEEQYQIDYEHMKDLLIRTYYPHFHRAVQSRSYFGANIRAKEAPLEVKPVEQAVTKTAISPPSIFQRHSRKRRERKIKEEEVAPVRIKQRRVSEEIPQPVELSNHRPRRDSIATNERKRKISHSDSSSDDDDNGILPDALPKPTFIKNGLRSNYYKSLSVDHDAKSSKSRSLRRPQQFSGSLPPFYTALFESDDDRLAHIDYQLPYDIYWSSQRTPAPSKEKKSKKICVEECMPSPRPLTRPKLEELTAEEQQIVSQTSIFLRRNLRRLKRKQETKTSRHRYEKRNEEGEHFPPLIFAQNFYHSTPTDDRQLSHRDLLHSFYNHIRRSHFAKVGRCSSELIDSGCHYAQLGQLTYLLNEVFDLLLNYKCQKSDILPSNALKKCPLKRLFPMYYELIAKPIDLTIIRKKLDQGEYPSYQGFEDDLLLLFRNAMTYCGEDSDVGRAVKELQAYFLHPIKNRYQKAIHLLENIPKGIPAQRNVRLFEEFIRRFHAEEVLFGQVREVLAEIIFEIDQNQSPPVLKTPYIIHCRCGSTFDETSLVQCYACQLWQHVSCVTIEDTSRPYYCFECHSLCEREPSACSKSQVQIRQENQTYSTITRADGLIVRLNECYLIKRQDDAQIFSVERLWLDAHQQGYASGFSYLRSDQIASDLHRKVFPNEVFRLPSSSDSIAIEEILRPCYVLDQGTFCKGKPIPEFTSDLISKEVFICEYRVDKSAKIFTRLTKSKQIGMNTKSYCFDSYVEKLTIKRDANVEPSSRRRSNKFTAKQFEEKSSHIDGLIEKIYCRFHRSDLMPVDASFSPETFFRQEPSADGEHPRGSKRLRTQISSSSPAISTRTKRPRRSSHSDIVRSVLDHLIASISPEDF